MSQVAVALEAHGLVKKGGKRQRDLFDEIFETTFIEGLVFEEDDAGAGDSHIVCSTQLFREALFFPHASPSCA